MSGQVLRRSASIHIDAPPSAVYDAVRQLDRMGEWSPENRGGRWIEGDGGNVGDRFEGDNQRGETTWTFPVVVSAAEPAVVFSFHSGEPDLPLVQWTYRFEAGDTGTTVTETWELLQQQPFIDALGENYPAERAAMVEGDLVTTLTNLKASFESS
jgi:uncharacterized protein YndB with AHSA1/START domain